MGIEILGTRYPEPFQCFRMGFEILGTPKPVQSFGMGSGLKDFVIRGLIGGSRTSPLHL